MARRSIWLRWPSHISLSLFVARLGWRSFCTSMWSDRCSPCSGGCYSEQPPSDDQVTAPEIYLRFTVFPAIVAFRDERPFSKRNLHFIMPREVTATSAIIWMAAVDEPAQPEPSLQPANVGAQTAGPWQSWPADGNIRVRHREVRIAGLTAGQSYQFALRVGTQTVASCKLVTLPEKLPLLGERPFI